VASAFNYRERALEYLALARSTHDPQTKAWAVELAALLQRFVKLHEWRSVRSTRGRHRAVRANRTSTITKQK
jgi:hypothetical protein